MYRANINKINKKKKYRNIIVKLYRIIKTIF